MEDLIKHLKDKKLLTPEVQDSIKEFYKNKNSKSKKLNFGKYRNKTVSEVAEFDSKYLEWLGKQSWCFDDIKKEISSLK